MTSQVVDRYVLLCRAQITKDEKSMNCVWWWRRSSPGVSPVDSHCNSTGVLTAHDISWDSVNRGSDWRCNGTSEWCHWSSSSITSRLHFTDTKTPPKPKAVKSEPRTPGPDAPSTKKVWIYVPNAQLTDSQNHNDPLAATSLDCHTGQ